MQAGWNIIGIDREDTILYLEFHHRETVASLQLIQRIDPELVFGADERDRLHVENGLAFAKAAGQVIFVAIDQRDRNHYFLVDVQDLSRWQERHALQAFDLQLIADESALAVEFSEGDKPKLVAVDGPARDLLPTGEVLVHLDEGPFGDRHTGFPVYS